LDLSARLGPASQFLLQARRGHFFINRLMLVLDHAIAVGLIAGLLALESLSHP
jgi:hypothetical protein